MGQLGNPGTPTWTPIVDKYSRPRHSCCGVALWLDVCVPSRRTSARRMCWSRSETNKMDALDYVGNMDLHFLDATAQVQARATLDANVGNIPAYRSRPRLSTSRS